MLRRAQGALEYLDRPASPADRLASLADVHRLNAWFGGYWLSEQAIDRLATRVPAAEPVRVIDVGGGRGDLAARLLRRAGRRGRRLHVIVVDRQATALAAGAGIVAVRADATALPFRAGAAHVVAAALLLHHLEPADATRCLVEMRAAARSGVVVNDLLRTRLALGLVWLVTRLFTRHAFARHDGPLSVRRAYSPDEIVVLAEKAGVGRPTIRRYPWLGRLVAVLE